MKNRYGAEMTQEEICQEFTQAFLRTGPQFGVFKRDRELIGWAISEIIQRGLKIQSYESAAKNMVEELARLKTQLSEAESVIESLDFNGNSRFAQEYFDKWHDDDTEFRGFH